MKRMPGFALVLALLFGTVLPACAQSLPDQSQSPPQSAPSQTQPVNNTPQPSPDTTQGEQSAPPAQESQPQAQPAPSEKESAPAQNQSASPAPSESPKDPNVPVLKHRPARKAPHKNTSSSQSGKVVVRNGGAKDGMPQIAPGSGGEQSQHKRENTTQLLATTDRNIKSVAGRQLTPAQQSMMEQIRTYVAQSKAASASGDLDRAHTLAYKAHLLSNELAKK